MGSLTAVLAAFLLSILIGSNGYQVTVYEESTETIEETTVEPESEATISTKRREISPGELIPKTIPEKTIDLEVIDVVTETEPEETEEYFALYTVNGHLLDEDLQKFLYLELTANGIEWWMPYAMMQMYLESAFDVYEHKNGKDFGLLQYRKQFWPEKAARYGLAGADIYNPYAQIHVYVQETRKRLKEYGLDIYETISRHKTSDYGSYDAAYVNAVLNHTIERVR